MRYIDGLKLALEELAISWAIGFAIGFFVFFVFWAIITS